MGGARKASLSGELHDRKESGLDVEEEHSRRNKNFTGPRVRKNGMR